MRALAPVEDSKVFLTSGGSDSIDTATKMSRRYWQLLGRTDRTLLITREHAYHGMHVAGTSLAGIEANAIGHGPLVGDVAKAAWDSPSALRDAIAAAGPEQVAAFFCEPVIGAVIAAPWIAEPFWRPDAGLWRHGYTYSGHAAAAIAALANLDLLEREALPKRALELEGDLAEALAPLEDHALVAEVRSGTGVLAAVQLSADALESVPGLPGRAVAASRRSGILTRALGIGALQISPPLVTDGDELKELREGLRSALDEVSSG